MYVRWQSRKRQQPQFGSYAGKVRDKAGRPVRNKRGSICTHDSVPMDRSARMFVGLLLSSRTYEFVASRGSSMWPPSQALPRAAWRARGASMRAATSGTTCMNGSINSATASQWMIGIASKRLSLSRSPGFHEVNMTPASKRVPFTVLNKNLTGPRPR